MKVQWFWRHTVAQCLQQDAFAQLFAYTHKWCACVHSVMLHAAYECKCLLNNWWFAVYYCLHCALQVNAMEYADAVISESMRVHVSTPMLALQAEKDVLIGESLVTTKYTTLQLHSPQYQYPTLQCTSYKL
jgi:cytochrome P450